MCYSSKGVLFKGMAKISAFFFRNMDSLSESSVDSGCFIVTTSQREEQGFKGVSKHHQQLFNQLTALRTVKPEDEKDNNNRNIEVIFAFKSPLVFWQKCNQEFT